MKNTVTIKCQKNQKIESVVDDHILNIGSVNKEDSISPASFLLTSLGYSFASEIESCIRTLKIDVDNFELYIKSIKDNHLVGSDVLITFLFSGKSIVVPKLIATIEGALSDSSGIAAILAKSINIKYDVYINGVKIDVSIYKRG